MDFSSGAKDFSGSRIRSDGITSRQNILRGEQAKARLQMSQNILKLPAPEADLFMQPVRQLDKRLPSLRDDQGWL